MSVRASIPAEGGIESLRLYGAADVGPLNIEEPRRIGRPGLRLRWDLDAQPGSRLRLILEWRSTAGDVGQTHPFEFVVPAEGQEPYQ